MDKMNQIFVCEILVELVSAAKKIASHLLLVIFC